MKRIVAGAILALAFGGILMSDRPARAADSEQSYFFPPQVVENFRKNMREYDWGKGVREKAEKRASHWMEMSDDAIWDLMFGPTISRSWMVWSDGFCPACKKSVPMYNWKPSAFAHPWKMRCPHCREWFPKNDFGAFYRSGLDEHGVFDPEKADRSLLFNTEHPDPKDRLHMFGVDDGEGYVEGDKRWRFIGCYLIYGIWRQQILKGLDALADAYLITGNADYATKAGILLDRVADLYPSMDFNAQAFVYEKKTGARGYVSNWHSCCPETERLVMIWDKIRPALATDERLVEFLSKKAEQHKLENPKKTFADIRRNIVDGLLIDPLNNKPKVDSNFPMTHMLYIKINKVMGTSESLAKGDEIIADMLTEGIAFDGLSGEKGLAGYSRIWPNGLARFFGEFLRNDPDFLTAKIAEFPDLKKTWRFFIDTHFAGKYYPYVADGGSYGSQRPAYGGMTFAKPSGGGAAVFTPSNYTLLWRMYRATGDPAYAQVMARGNKDAVDGLPYDVFLSAEETEAIRKGVAEAIEKHGAEPERHDVNYEKWRLAMVRSGAKDNRRGLWMHYGPKGRHCHSDGLNLGLFACGLDLMPECGYPAVQFGGWRSDKGRWYKETAAHNTVVVDQAQMTGNLGDATLWASGERLRAFGAACPGAYGGLYERNCALIDTPDGGFYVFDVFRVRGGKEHLKFTQSHFGEMTIHGATPKAADAFGPKQWQLRHFAFDAKPASPWSAEWAVEDHYGYRPPDAPPVRFRQTDLTRGAEAGRCEIWFTLGYGNNKEFWQPRAVVRRSAESDGLGSAFVGVLQAWDSAPPVREMERLDKTSADDAAGPVAVRLALASGHTDIAISRMGGEGAWSIDWQGRKIETDGKLALLRFDAEGRPSRMALAGGSVLRCDATTLNHAPGDTFTEATLSDDKPAAAARSAWEPAN